jgi:hypothetical protein
MLGRVLTQSLNKQQQQTSQEAEIKGLTTLSIHTWIYNAKQLLAN